MEKKKYFKPKSVYLPIDIRTSLLEPSGGFEGIGEGKDNGDPDAKDRSFINFDDETEW